MQKVFSVLPACFCGELDNQLRYCLVPRRGVRAVTLLAAVETGSVHEGPDTGSGLSHFLEHMLFQGCRNYPGQGIADTVNDLGGDVNAYTSFSRTVYYMELPAAALPQGVDMLCSMVTSPEFPAAKFKHERSVILRERDMGKDSPDRALFEALMRLTFPHHNARHPIIGYAAKIASVTREQMIEYYRRRYAPGRTTVVAVGDFDRAKCEKLLARHFGKWALGRLDEPVLPPEPEPAAARRLPTVFSDPLGRLAFAAPVPGGASPELGKLEILSGVLGASDASLLVRELKTKRSLVMDAGSFLYTPGFGGLLGGSLVFAPERANEVEDALNGVLESLSRDSIDPAAVEREKLQQYADTLRRLRANSAIAREVLANLLTAGTPDYTGQHLHDLAAITAEDLTETAAKYLAPGRRALVLQLPPETAKAQSAAQAYAERPRMVRGGTDGIRHLAWIDSTLPLKHFQLVIPGGTIREDAVHSGCSQLICELLFAGTERYGETELAEQLDATGAVLDVSSGANTLALTLDVPAENFARAFELTLHLLGSSSFAAKEFERERGNLLKTLSSRAQNPGAAARDLALKLLYGTHPYARPRQGLAPSISALDRMELKNFYHSLFIREKTVAGFGGVFAADEIADCMRKLSESLTWSTHNLPEPPPVVFPETDVAGQTELPREQTVVLRALPGCSNTSPDRLALEIARTALNGLAAKLFKSIREERGLAYDTGCSFTFGGDRGLCLFHASTAPESARQVLALLNGEIARLGSEGLDEKEFTAAKSGLGFDFARRFEQVDRLLFELVLDEFYGNDPRETIHAERELNRITLHDVNSVLSRYFRHACGASVLAGKLPQDVPVQ